MKHFKKSNDFETKSKIAKKLETIAFWTQEIIKSCIYGLIAFCVYLFIVSNTSVSIFLGIFTAYMFIGFKISEIVNPIIGFDFCIYNGVLSLVMITISIIGVTVSSSIIIITWPLLTAGIVLLIAAAIGVLGISFTNYYEE
jgi:hypothetical protein